MEYIDKEKLMADANAHSPNGEVRVTAVDLSGQDRYCARSSMIIHPPLMRLTVTDAVLRLPISGKSNQGLYINMIQAINDKLDEIAALIKGNRLKPKLWDIPSYQVCAKCGGFRLYKMELQTDHAIPRLYSPINKESSEVQQEDIPYRMGGSFCMDCGSFCETVFRLGKMPGVAEEEEDNDE